MCRHAEHWTEYGTQFVDCSLHGDNILEGLSEYGEDYAGVCSKYEEVEEEVEDPELDDYLYQETEPCPKKKTCRR